MRTLQSYIVSSSIDDTTGIFTGSSGLNKRVDWIGL